MAIMRYLIICYAGFIGKPAYANAGIWALDYFVNTTIFNRYTWESVSSHAWSERDSKWWAIWVIRIIDKFQKDHCLCANKREQPIVDLMLSKSLHKQTIGKKRK